MADGKKPPSREGLVGITFWAEPKLRDEVKRLAIDSGKPVQELMVEATQDLLAKHRKRSRSKA